MATAKSMIDGAIEKIAQKGQGNVHVEFVQNDKSLDLEFMIEHGKIWVLSHHDRTKMKLEQVDQYLAQV